tara:strand:+ start:136 stop:309 length:174 start_codon:yes stop_codon:yes gene_type:complete
MATRRITKGKAHKVIEGLKQKQATIIFYTDKIRISLPNMESVSVWQKRYPSGKVAMI